MRTERRAMYPRCERVILIIFIRWLENEKVTLSSPSGNKVGGLAVLIERYALSLFTTAKERIVGAFGAECIWGEQTVVRWIQESALSFIEKLGSGVDIRRIGKIHSDEIVARTIRIACVGTACCHLKCCSKESDFVRLAQSYIVRSFLI